jgi:hypothetical protein
MQAKHRTFDLAQSAALVYAKHILSPRPNNFPKQRRQYFPKTSSQFRCRRRSHQRSNDDGGGYPSEIKQPSERRELSWQRMPRKAGCKNKADDSRV